MAKTAVQQEWLRLSEVRVLTGLGKNTLDEAARSGALRTERTSPTAWRRTKREWVEDFMAGRKSRRRRPAA